MLSKDLLHKVELKLGRNLESINRVGSSAVTQFFQITTTEQSFFLKIQSRPSDQLILEAHGLKLINKAVLTPRCHDANEHFLLLDWIESTRKTPCQNFAESLASLHQQAGQSFGLDRNNYIGITPQKNLPQNTSWRDFFWNNRLLFQIELAISRGALPTDFPSQKLAIVCDRLLTHSPTPSLVHGDLWSGNTLFTEDGQTYFIDPACSYSDKEVDLAMTELFGRPPQAFYDHYLDRLPLPPGYEDRKILYNLYHLLNHLNIFGQSYLGQVRESFSILMNKFT
jgi:protein-ribulosamine 3-kinase